MVAAWQRRRIAALAWTAEATVLTRDLLSRDLLSQNQRQAVLVVTDYDDFGVGALGQVFGGFDAFPFE